MAETKMDKTTDETQEVRAAHKFDESKLAAFLGDTVKGFQGPLIVKQFAGGQSNPTYMLETPGKKYVLRRKPPGTLLKSAHAVDREFRVLSALYAQDFPVPHPHVLCSDESVIGTMFYVMDFVPGRVFFRCELPGMSVEDRAKAFDSANATLAKLHTLDYRALGLEDFGKPGNYFARQISRWAQQYQASETQKIPEMDKLIAWLPGAVPEGDESCIVHGDYSFHNVFFHPTEPRIVAVVDWELSTIGHPLGDLTYHVMEWYRPDGGDPRGTLANYNEAELAARGIPTLRAYIDKYCERTGRPPLKNLEFYQAYNLFRLAAIVQGIVGRAQAGTAADANAASMAARVPDFAKVAWRFAQKAGAI